VEKAKLRKAVRTGEGIYIAVIVIGDKGVDRLQFGEVIVDDNGCTKVYIERKTLLVMR